jgi:hypothetical protein
LEPRRTLNRVFWTHTSQPTQQIRTVKKPERWKIEQTVSIDEVTLVELREPVSASFDSDQSEKWVVIWARGTSLFSIYGPDREHAMDYYQKHYKADPQK